jgi:transcriptional regulator with XRE-family HTH domain
LGISQPTLSRIERGMGRIDALTIRRLADSRGVTVDHLHGQIDSALARAENAVRLTSPSKKEEEELSWCEVGVGIAGVLGLAGLLGYAVAAVLSEEEKPPKPVTPRRPLPARRT